MTRVYRLPWPALGQVHSALARRLGLAASPHRKLEVVRRRVLVLPFGLESLSPRDSREQSSLEVGATRSPLGRRSLPRPARPAAVYAPQRIEAQHSSCQKRKERHENKRSARA